MVGVPESMRTRRGERRSIGETKFQVQSECGQFREGCAWKLDRVCVREAQPQRKLSALTPRSFGLSTLPRGVWLTIRCAYDLHHDKCSVAEGEFE